MTKINEKILKNAEDNAEKEPFLLVIYDLPSENRKGISKGDKEELRSKRLSVTNEMFVKATHIQHSSYIVRTEKVRHIIDFIDEKYNDTKWQNEVSVRIAGNVFKDTVIDVLKESVKDNLNKLWEQLDIIEAKKEEKKIEKEKNPNAEIDVEAEDRFFASLKQKMYQQNRTINALDERINDLEKIGFTKTEELKEKLSSFKKKRSDILYSVTYRRW